MAVNLVLRLCQVDEADGGMIGAGKLPSEPGYVAAAAHIAYTPFTDGIKDVLGGYHTLLNLKTFYNMPADQQTDMDTLWGKINSAADIATKLGRIHRFESILSKWENDDIVINGYDTPDDIQTQLLAIDTGF